MPTLTPIEGKLKEQLLPKTFIVVEATSGQRTVGTFVRWQFDHNGHVAVITEAGTGHRRLISLTAIAHAWWAPMGYRE